MIVNGKSIASSLLEEVRESFSEGMVPVVRAVAVEPTAATQSYLRIKEEKAQEAGMRLEVVRVSAQEAAVRAAILAPGADAVIVQLPLPAPLAGDEVLESIPFEKDADVLSSRAYAQFRDAAPGHLVPPVAAAVDEILRRAQIRVDGMRVAVVGQGKLVGKPVAELLMRQGANVTVIDRSTEHREELLKDAECIVSGVGVPYLITPDLIKEGVILIDAGTSGQSGGVVGDMHPDCEKKASLFTPVPGGVGPIAVAWLFKNAATLYKKGRLA